MRRTIGRRDLLRVASGAAMSVAACAAGCARPAPFACTDAGALPPEDATARASLAYVEPSANVTRTCSACQQYLGPPDGRGCGSCKVLKGPVHPAGTCKAFAAKLM